MKSPKGNYRTKEFAILGVIFLVIVALSGGFDQYGQWHAELALSPNGWVFKQLNNIAEIFIGLFLLYVGHRVINHKRTHDFIKDEGYSFATMAVWILAIAYVVGNGLR